MENAWFQLFFVLKNIKKKLICDNMKSFERIQKCCFQKLFFLNRLSVVSSMKTMGGGVLVTSLGVLGLVCGKRS